MLSVKVALLTLALAVALHFVIQFNSNTQPKQSTVFEQTRKVDGFASASSRDVENKTINTIGAAVEPPCPIWSLPDTARSAFARAKSTACKQRIVDVACASQLGTLYPTDHIEATCQLHRTSDRGKYLGCFHDKIDDRDLVNGVEIYEHDNSPKKCIYRCIRDGHMYAAVQYGVECFCGSNYGRHGRAAEALCNVPCPSPHNGRSNGRAANGEFCGGIGVQNIYSTGITRISSADNDTKYIDPAADPSQGRSARSARIVFLLIVSGRNYRQVLRLLRRIYHVDHYFLLHVDKSSEYMYKKLQEAVGDGRLENVRFTSYRLKPIWGGSSLLTVILEAMRELISGAWSGWKWTHLINLSESDYPLKTEAELNAYLTHTGNSSFIAANLDDKMAVYNAQSMGFTFIECENYMYRVAKRDYIKGLRYMGGSDWFVFHHNFVNFLAKSVYSADAADADADTVLVKTLHAYLKLSVMAPESFFHMSIVNSRFCETNIFHNLRLINWNREIGCSCANRPTDACGCSPMALRDFQIPNILVRHQNVTAFFGRKFDSLIDRFAISRMDAYLDAGNCLYDRMLLNQEIDCGVEYRFQTDGVETGDKNATEDSSKTNTTTSESTNSTSSSAPESAADAGKVPDAFLAKEAYKNDRFWYSLFDENISIAYDDDYFRATATFRIAATYDAHLTLVHALTRLAVSSLPLAQHTSRARPVELTLYRKGIEPQQLLMKYEVDFKSDDDVDIDDDADTESADSLYSPAATPAVFETRFSLWSPMPIKQLEPEFGHLCIGRLVGVELGTEYDAKETMFRGTPGLSSVFTRLKLVTRWAPAAAAVPGAGQNSRPGPGPWPWPEPRPGQGPEPRPEQGPGPWPGPGPGPRPGQGPDPRPGPGPGPGAGPPESCSVRLVLYDPTETAKHQQQLTVPPHHFASVYEPEIERPMLPGFWKLVAWSNDIALRRVVYQFLVSPQTYFDGKRVELAETDSGSTEARRDIVRDIHNGPGFWAIRQSPDAGLDELSDVVSDEQTRLEMRVQAAASGRFRGRELDDWVHWLYARVFRPEASCRSRPRFRPRPRSRREQASDDTEAEAEAEAETETKTETETAYGAELEECEETEWSSFSTDENSSIGEANSATGRLR